VIATDGAVCLAPPATAMPWSSARSFELPRVPTAGNFAVPEPECAVSFAVQIEPAQGSPPDVDYRWDADTDILTAAVRAKGVGEGLCGSVELMGGDGAWVNLDVTGGRIHGVEVAVWPDVRKLPALVVPAAIEDGAVAVPLRNLGADVGSVAIDTALVAEADQAERTIHFRVGPPRQARTVRIARDLLLDVDPAGRIAGVWLLNVPPFPEEL
jgi:hypothetical protein